MKTIYIASGECVANDLKNKGFDNVYPFNEAMCEGDVCRNIRSREFIIGRMNAYGITEYNHFADSLDKALSDTDNIELYFDYDMFCAVNTITLLAYLECVDYRGKINFNLIEQDGTANVLKRFSIDLGNFYDAYIQILVERRIFETGVEHLDKVLPLYLEYKSPENEITRFIKSNLTISRTELCKRILIEFPEYGIGDASAYKLIDIIIC